MKDKDLLILVAIVLGVICFTQNQKPVDPVPVNDAIAMQAEVTIKHLARGYADLADTASGMEPDAAAQHIKSHAKGMIDESFRPLNEMIDKAREDGKFSEAMKSASSGYRKAGK